MSKPKIQQFDYQLPDHVVLDDQAWKNRNLQTIDIAGNEQRFAELILELGSHRKLTTKIYHSTMRAYARNGLPWLSKSQLLQVYDTLCQQGILDDDPTLKTRIQMKPVRTQSGVTVVTVLTKPYPCPGKCVFCPTDVRMPKSYLHDEPGAQRAERYAFDPYKQTAGRIAALEKIGHPAEKIELLILGGTWSSYQRAYQEWFVKRCFDAMNGVDSESLAEAQALNEQAKRRNVGLVVETRQDHIDIDEIRWMRTLGVTKVQVGIQSMDPKVLRLNKRGHDTQSTRNAFQLLRLGGFKIHGHWMPNLLGATPESDTADYRSLWEDPMVRPDELKIYPCMLLENAELYRYWQRGEYHPYSEEEVVDILVHCLLETPPYVRLTRVIRDIPTNNVVEGFTKSNLRQIAEGKLKKEGKRSREIRSREVRRETIAAKDLILNDVIYTTKRTTEHFLSFETAEGKIAGFLRLSLPNRSTSHPLPELEDHAMIREVHVYGPALSLGVESQGEAQHAGLGSRLIERAIELARDADYQRIAVISAVGTRNYYRKHQFEKVGLYMTRSIQ
ncbi:MAG: tRNA uridine(34) 5-carboxymethylaminomethyl modification radical SAM/GNAT enzyme Elp3, partial [Chloroflexota bacterium]